jgi:hypothetical protein
MGCDYPMWLENIFMTYSVNFGQVWDSKMPTPSSREVMKKMWFDRLSRFCEETIVLAMRQSWEEPFPHLHVMVKLCEEISAQRKYSEVYLVEDKSSESSSLSDEEIERNKQMAEKAKEARERCARLLGYKFRG